MLYAKNKVFGFSFRTTNRGFNGGEVGLEASDRILSKKIVRRINSNSNIQTHNKKISSEHMKIQPLAMRDLYNRKKLLTSWLNRIDTDLHGSDKEDVSKLIEYMQEKGKSILWMVRCITALLQIKKQLPKSFRETSKEDIKLLFEWMDNKNYRVSTHEKYRIILKLFFKTVYGNNEFEPDPVKWFSVQVGKEHRSKEKDIDIAEYLEEDEVSKIIEAAPTIQKKAFLACMYESGSRPEEYLRLTNLDCKIDSNGAILFLRGKTGERRVRIVVFAKLLQQWLDIHPLKKQLQFPLWISEATNCRNQPLGLRGAEKIIEDTFIIAKLHNKQHRLYTLRHSRVTHLAKHLTEAQMCVFFGWVHGTKVVRRYIHLSGKDLDNTLLSIGQGQQIQQEENQLKIIKCNRCSEMLSPTQQFCSRCGLTTRITEQYSKQLNLEQENNELKLEIKNIREENENRIKNQINARDEEILALRSEMRSMKEIVNKIISSP